MPRGGGLGTRRFAPGHCQCKLSGPQSNASPAIPPSQPSKPSQPSQHQQPSHPGQPASQPVNELSASNNIFYECRWKSMIPHGSKEFHGYPRIPWTRMDIDCHFSWIPKVIEEAMDTNGHFAFRIFALNSSDPRSNVLCSPAHHTEPEYCCEPAGVRVACLKLPLLA